MTPSADAYALIKRHEGLRLHAYRDPVGIWTIGWGHTEGVTRGQTISRHQAEALLAHDVGRAAHALSWLVTVPLNQGMFDALTSFVFNLGEGRLADSTLLILLNGQDYAGAAREFGKWVKGQVKGRKITLPGLVKRRAEERALFEREGLLT